MYFLIMRILLNTEECDSLKEKRRITKSLIARLKAKYNISIAETGSLDNWGEAELGLCSVANDAQYLQQIANKLEDLIEEIQPGRLIDFEYALPRFDELE